MLTLTRQAEDRLFRGFKELKRFGSKIVARLDTADEDEYMLLLKEVRVLPNSARDLS